MPVEPVRQGTLSQLIPPPLRVLRVRREVGDVVDPEKVIWEVSLGDVSQFLRTLERWDPVLAEEKVKLKTLRVPVPVCFQFESSKVAELRRHCEETRDLFIFIFILYRNQGRILFFLELHDLE